MNTTHAHTPPHRLNCDDNTSQMLTNYELLDIARSYKLPLNAVVQRDQLLEQTPRFGNYILNLQPSTEGGGTHWVAAIIQHDTCYYFDSFGAPPPTELNAFLAKFEPRPPKRIEYNKLHIQDLPSQLCGWYCIGLFLYARANKHLPLFTACNRFCAMFNLETLFNGTVLKLFFQRRKPTIFVKRRLLTANVK